MVLREYQLGAATVRRQCASLFLVDATSTDRVRAWQLLLHASRCSSYVLIIARVSMSLSPTHHWCDINVWHGDEMSFAGFQFKPRRSLAPHSCRLECRLRRNTLRDSLHSQRHMCRLYALYERQDADSEGVHVPSGCRGVQEQAAFGRLDDPLLREGGGCSAYSISTVLRIA